MKLQLALLPLVLCSAGCMPFKSYPLPVSGADAPSTFAPIATAASNLGYKYWQWPDSVSVEPDATTRITYGFDASKNYAMYVIIKHKDVPGGLDAAFARGKRIGDDIWNRAMALRPPPTPVQVVAPAPQPMVQINVGP